MFLFSHMAAIPKVEWLCEPDALDLKILCNVEKTFGCDSWNFPCSTICYSELLLQQEQNVTLQMLADCLEIEEGCITLIYSSAEYQPPLLKSLNDKCDPKLTFPMWQKGGGGGGQSWRTKGGILEHITQNYCHPEWQQHSLIGITKSWRKYG